MRQIADFLGIAFDPCLLTPSHLGHPLREQQPYTGKVNDTWESMLDSRDLALIGLQEKTPLDRHLWRHVPHALIQLGLIRLGAKTNLLKRALRWNTTA
jgi:hypothetical protein